MNLRSIPSPILFNVSLPLSLVPLFQLEISLVRRGTSPLALQYDEYRGANDRYEVEWEVHQVSNDGVRCEFSKGLLDHLAQSCHGISTTLDLPPSTNQIRAVLLHKGPVKCIHQGLVEEERPRYEISDSRTFAECEQGGGYCCCRARCERHDGHLWHECNREHQGRHSN